MHKKEVAPKWSSDNLPDDPEELKHIIRLILEDDSKNAQKQEEALNAMKSLLSSWRWRLGNMLVSAAEKAMRRKNVRLAADNVASILETLTAKSRDRDNLGLSFINDLSDNKLRFYYGEDAKKRYTDDKFKKLDIFLKSKQRLDFTVVDRPALSILLVLYNRSELTLACLQSILSTVRIPCQLVLVDNASTDRTAELLERIDGATVIRNDTNEGFLKACNTGARSANGEYLLFLNNDAVLFDDAVSNAIRVFEEERDVGGVGGKILLLDGTLQEAGSIVWDDGSCLGYGRQENPYEPEYMFRREVDYCSGAFLLVRTKVFADLSGFDMDFSPAYYEETDFCLRLHENGYRVVYDPRIVILHYEFASTEKSNEAIKLQKHNRKTFIHKHEEYLRNRLKPKDKNVVSARFFPDNKKILFIDDRVPHQYFGSGFPRSNFILSTLVESGYQVTFYPLNFPKEDDWSSVYSDIPGAVEVMLGCGRSGLQEHLMSRRDYYSAVFVSRPHNMEFFSQVAKKINWNEPYPMIIYDAEAIFSLRDAKKYELFSGKEHKNIDTNVAAEVALASDADVVVAVSNKERNVFRKYYNGYVGVIGHALDIAPFDVVFEERADFLFVGNMDYDGSPNVDSMVWFSEQVFPLIQRQIPEVKIKLVGANASSEIQQLAADNVMLLGRQSDLDEYYSSCRVFLAPTRFAGGIPYKVHEAAAKGMPVVSSELIREQLGWENGKEILSASVDDATQFARQCIDLYQDKRLWSNIRENALGTMQKDCSVSEIKKEIATIFDRIEGDA